MHTCTCTHPHMHTSTHAQQQQQHRARADKRSSHCHATHPVTEQPLCHLTLEAGTGSGGGAGAALALVAGAFPHALAKAPEGGFAGASTLACCLPSPPPAAPNAPSPPAGGLPACASPDGCLAAKGWGLPVPEALEPEPHQHIGAHNGMRHRTA